MKKPEWVLREVVFAGHEQSLAQFGGSAGVRDEGLLDSALGKPLNIFAHGKPSLFDLASSYALGIVKNHPFIDGNKRTAFASLIVFLGLNGMELDAPPEAATAVMLALAAGEIGEDVLARWVADHMRLLEAPSVQP